MGRALTLLILATLSLMFSGCETTRPLYSWGRYEPLSYSALTETVSAEEQIAVLEEDLEIAKSENQATPPGVNAYLGYLYLKIGNVNYAVTAFEKEKTLFPESEVFIDRLLEKLISPHTS